MTTLHIDKGLPSHWVVIHDGETWMVPTIVDGWRLRSRHLAPWRLGPPLTGPAARITLRTIGVPCHQDARP